MREKISMNIESELLDVLRRRAALNCRTLTGEVVYLIECALAEKSETTREFLHIIHRAQGAPTLEAKGQA